MFIETTKPPMFFSENSQQGIVIKAFKTDSNKPISFNKIKSNKNSIVRDSVSSIAIKLAGDSQLAKKTHRRLVKSLNTSWKHEQSLLPVSSRSSLYK
jgi:hypothetical protein